MPWQCHSLRPEDADARYSRRRLLITNQLLTMVNLFILSALIFGDVVEIWHVYISSILLGAAMALTAPARQAMIRGLVNREEMMNAVAVRLVFQAGQGLIPGSRPTARRWASSTRPPHLTGAACP